MFMLLLCWKSTSPTHQVINYEYLNPKCTAHTQHNMSFSHKPNYSHAAKSDFALRLSGVLPQS